jgi:hypothetical protein
MGRARDRDHRALCLALKPRYAELYGCCSLLDDVTPGVASMLAGQIHTPPGPGLGTAFDPMRCRTVWSEISLNADEASA